jgi:hypothetical protein
MTDTNQEKEEELLRRMLATKPTPHKPSERHNRVPDVKPDKG